MKGRRGHARAGFAIGHTIRLSCGTAVRECTVVHLTAPRRLLFPAVPPPQPKQRARRGTPWMELLLVRDLVTLGVLTGLFAVVLLVLDATRSRP